MASQNIVNCFFSSKMRVKRWGGGLRVKDVQEISKNQSVFAEKVFPVKANVNVFNSVSTW